MAYIFNLYITVYFGGSSKIFVPDYATCEIHVWLSEVIKDLCLIWYTWM